MALRKNYFLVTVRLITGHIISYFIKGINRNDVNQKIKKIEEVDEILSTDYSNTTTFKK